jgi:hypothetical protein
MGWHVSDSERTSVLQVFYTFSITTPVVSALKLGKLLYNVQGFLEAPADILKLLDPGGRVNIASKTAVVSELKWPLRNRFRSKPATVQIYIVAVTLCNGHRALPNGQKCPFGCACAVR